MRRLLHKLFDHLHIEHHRRPWDGEHINGTLDDTMPFLGPAFLLSLLLPAHTLTAFLAGLAQAYVVHGTRIPAHLRAALYALRAENADRGVRTA